MLVQIHIHANPVSETELKEGDKVYYLLKRMNDDFAHGPFTIRISRGIISLENVHGVGVPLSKFGDSIQLIKPDWGMNTNEICR